MRKYLCDLIEIMSFTGFYQEMKQHVTVESIMTPSQYLYSCKPSEEKREIFETLDKFTITIKHHFWKSGHGIYVSIFFEKTLRII